jgi:MFS family permease
MSSASMIFTTMMSITPKLLDKKYIVKANEILSIIWSLTFVGGMAIGGFVVDIYGVKVSFVIDVLFFVVASLLLLRVHFNISIIKTKDKIYQSIKDGVIYIKNNKLIIHLMILHASVGLTIFDVLITILADYHYKYIIAVPLAIGLSNASRAVSLMIGAFILTKWINNKNLTYLFIFQGFSIILWSFFQNDFYISLACMFLIGFGITTLWSFTYALLQKHTQKEYMGRVLAYNEMIFMLTSVFTTMFIGGMTSFISLFAITFILGLLMLSFSVYYKIWIFSKL